MTAKRKRLMTSTLVPGDVVATMPLFGQFVSVAKGIVGEWRTVDSVGVIPADRKSDPNRQVMFTDGKQAQVRDDAIWLIKGVDSWVHETEV